MEQATTSMSELFPRALRSDAASKTEANSQPFQAVYLRQYCACSRSKMYDSETSREEFKDSFRPTRSRDRVLWGTYQKTKEGVIEMSFDWTPEELQKVVDENKIVIFMKGTPDQPQCGFSARGAQVISMVANELGMETFASVNVLSDPRARPALKEWSDFPTIPQVFINGELIGGSDIALELYESEIFRTCSTMKVKHRSEGADDGAGR